MGFGEPTISTGAGNELQVLVPGEVVVYLNFTDAFPEPVLATTTAVAFKCADVFVTRVAAPVVRLVVITAKETFCAKSNDNPPIATSIIIFLNIFCIFFSEFYLINFSLYNFTNFQVL